MKYTRNVTILFNIATLKRNSYASRSHGCFHSNVTFEDTARPLAIKLSLPLRHARHCGKSVFCNQNTNHLDVIARQMLTRRTSPKKTTHTLESCSQGCVLPPGFRHPTCCVPKLYQVWTMPAILWAPDQVAPRAQNAKLCYPLGYKECWSGTELV